MEQEYNHHRLDEISYVEDWRELSQCGEENHELFFSGAAEDIKAAKAICSFCVVQTDCLEYAVRTNQDLGVWGGLDEHERKNFRRRWQSLKRREKRVS